MAHTDQLDLVADQLGYRDAFGYVDRTTSEVGARDFVWRDLSEKCRVDAAYFRGAVPLVAFIGADSSQEVASAQRRLWNFGRVPVLIAATPSEVVALSCVTQPTPHATENGAVLGSARPQQRLDEILQEFTRYSVESGRVTVEHRNQFRRHDRVDFQLLNNLRRLRTRLLKSNLTFVDIEQLLGRSIFIRYLEDKGILSEGHLLELGSYRSFDETLRAGPNAVIQLFEALAEHFNGDVFRTRGDESNLSVQAVHNLAEFFSAADLDTGQQSLWPYDFNVIPSELISSIYEHLIAETQEEDAAFYTPRHVVDLVLDELLPWQGGTDRPTILDPACGSGIFLAEAFRRLTYRHTISNGQPPTYERLSALLMTSVYGVDKNEVAIGVTAFSLYLALLEHVDPPTVWREARLPTLVNLNLVVSDFFDNHLLSDRNFDLVVGNPPWKSSLTPAARSYVHEAGIKLPDQQMALAFLWRATELITGVGSVGLVISAKSLLHNHSVRAEAARLRIFSDLNVETVVDLSPLRRETFDAAIGPAALVIVRAQSADDGLEAVVHVSPRSTPLADAIDGIVVSQENIQQIPRSLAATSALVWKTYLWGGPADFNLITRLRETFPTLESVKKKNNWISGQGFQVAGGGQEDASEIVGMPLLKTADVEAMRQPPSPSAVVTSSIMHRRRNPQLYRAPHIVMRKGFNVYPISTYLDFDAAFTDGLFAIAGPAYDAGELRLISGLLNSSVARYWFFMTSSSWGVEREQIFPKEFLSFPIPPINGTVRREIIKAVRLAVDDRSPEEEWRPALERAAFSAYGLTRNEQDLVLDGLETSLDEYRKGSASFAYQPLNDENMAKYALLLQSHLNASESVRWSTEFIERSRGYALMACHASSAATLNFSAPFSLNRLLTSSDTPLDGWRSPAAVMQPSVIIVQGTDVYLVKPDERRCWTKSAAMRDAGEVLSAILTVPAHGEI